MSSNIDQETFDREISICKELSENNNCHWGECKKCGVIPLLVKLNKGILLETVEEVNKSKDQILNLGVKNED